MRSIGLSNEVYLMVLNTKHKLEQKKGRIVSYDEVLEILVKNYFGKLSDSKISI